MDRIYYQESQKFTQIWLWFLLGSGLLFLIGVAFAGVYIQIIQGKPFGDNPMSDTGVLVFFILSLFFSLGLILFMKSFHLETRIDRLGISYRFFPLVPKWHTIYREEIINWEIVTKFVFNYGIRFGTNSKTLNIQGDKQLALKLSSGKILYLGTQRPEEISQALQKFFDRQPTY